MNESPDKIGNQLASTGGDFSFFSEAEPEIAAAIKEAKSNIRRGLSYLVAISENDL